MSEQLDETYQPPWNMPSDIFWNYDEYAELNRLQWVSENRPDLTMDEILAVMPVRNDVLATFIQERHTSELVKAAFEANQNTDHEAKYRHRILEISRQAMKFDPDSEE